MWPPSLSYGVTGIATSFGSGYSYHVADMDSVASPQNYLEKAIPNCDCSLLGKHTSPQEDLELSIEMFERMKLVLLTS